MHTQWLPRLSADERAGYTRLKTAPLRHVYLISRSLCRLVLSRYAAVDPQDWQFTKNRHGKPRLAAPARFSSLKFNLTHTNGLIAVLVTRAGEAGLDAESILRSVDVAAISSHVFSRSERAILAKLPPKRRTRQFFKMWVLKEAYLKGLGTGLWRDPTRLTIKLDAHGRPLPLGDWQLALHRPTAHHIAATALRRPRNSPPIAVRWHRADALLQSSARQ
jgi:4'-phosphopantetheinyl transferase